jgi:lysophospholipase L1-like esterase
MKNTIQRNDSILFQGDSITDAGRQESPDGLGGGYVAMIAGILEARHADLGLKVTNRGLGGDRTTELLTRWRRDTLDLKPQVLSIKIGVNDVWRLRGAWNGQMYVPPDQYRQNYRTLLDQACAAGIRQLVLMSPTTIFDETDAEVSALLDERAACVAELAREYGAVYVPTRETQKEALRSSSEVKWTSDGCHPTTAGHALLGASWLKAVGL